MKGGGGQYAKNVKTPRGFGKVDPWLPGYVVRGVWWVCSIPPAHPWPSGSNNHPQDIPHKREREREREAPPIEK